MTTPNIMQRRRNSVQILQCELKLNTSSDIFLIFTRKSTIFTNDTANDYLENGDIEQPPAKKRKFPKSLDGQFFKIIEWKSNINIRAQCMLCENGTKNSIIGAATNGTANLTRHMRRKHPEKLDSFIQYIDCKKTQYSEGKGEHTCSKEKVIPSFHIITINTICFVITFAHSQFFYCSY